MSCSGSATFSHYTWAGEMRICNVCGSQFIVKVGNSRMLLCKNLKTEETLEEDAIYRLRGYIELTHIQTISFTSAAFVNVWVRNPLIESDSAETKEFLYWLGSVCGDTTFLEQAHKLMGTGMSRKSAFENAWNVARHQYKKLFGASIRSKETVDRIVKRLSEDDGADFLLAVNREFKRLARESEGLCQMVDVHPDDNGYPHEILCMKPIVGVTEDNVLVCDEHAKSMRDEGFEVTLL